MDNLQLGKRLREARIAKKMTQSDVVGTFITRNMLSQIESGVASPSLKTLEYLANTLELPIHYLISEAQITQEQEICSPLDQDSCSTCSICDLYLKCKTAFLRGDYSFVTDNAAALEDSRSPLCEEGSALLARARLEIAKK